MVAITCSQPLERVLKGCLCCNVFVYGVGGLSAYEAYNIHVQQHGHINKIEHLIMKETIKRRNDDDDIFFIYATTTSTAAQVSNKQNMKKPLLPKRPFASGSASSFFLWSDHFCGMAKSWASLATASSDHSVAWMHAADQPDIGGRSAKQRGWVGKPCAFHIKCFPMGWTSPS